MWVVVNVMQAGCKAKEDDELGALAALAQFRQRLGADEAVGVLLTKGLTQLLRFPLYRT